MSLSPAVLKFLHDHEYWIRNASEADWTEFYLDACKLDFNQVGEITNTLLSVGVDSASFLKNLQLLF